MSNANHLVVFKWVHSAMLQCRKNESIKRDLQLGICCLWAFPIDYKIKINKKKG